MEQWLEKIAQDAFNDELEKISKAYGVGKAVGKTVGKAQKKLHDLLTTAEKTKKSAVRGYAAGRYKENVVLPPTGRSRSKAEKKSGWAALRRLITGNL